jgi:heme exporter protein A
MTAPFLLRAVGLGMIRGDRVLFQALSLTLGAGEGVVLRGANGAGKTTLLRVLAGLTCAETGAVERAAPVHWIGHQDGLSPGDTPRGHLRLWRKAWGGTGDVDAALETAGLARAADVAVRNLSAGQRRRTALARLGLIRRPLWLLDEPYAALDGGGRDGLGRLIAAHRADGGGVIVSLHGEAGLADARELIL